MAKSCLKIKELVCQNVRSESYLYAAWGARVAQLFTKKAITMEVRILADEICGSAAESSGEHVFEFPVHWPWMPGEQGTDCGHCTKCLNN